MARKPEGPWERVFRRADGSTYSYWYCTIKQGEQSKQVRLSAIEKEAWKMWHKLVSDINDKKIVIELRRESPTFNQLCNSALGNVGRGDSYAKVFALSEFGKQRIDELDADELFEFIDDKETWKNKDAAKIALHKIFRHATRAKLIARPPFLIKTGPQSTREFPKNGIPANLLKTFREGCKNKQLVDFITVMAVCGCRPSELLRTTADWISFENDVAIISLPSKHSKTKKPRNIIVVGEGAEIIRRRVVGGGLLFSSSTGKQFTTQEMGGHFYCWRTRLGVDPTITLYHFRHLFITSQLALGALPIDQIALAVGNSSEMIRKTYCHWIGIKSVMINALKSTADYWK